MIYVLSAIAIYVALCVFFLFAWARFFLAVRDDEDLF